MKEFKVGDFVEVIQGKTVIYKKSWMFEMNATVGYRYEIDDVNSDGSFSLNGCLFSYIPEWLKLAVPKRDEFRERLIISIAGGPISADLNNHNVANDANHIIRLADEIIKQLEEE